MFEETVCQNTYGRLSLNARTEIPILREIYKYFKFIDKESLIVQLAK